MAVMVLPMLMDPLLSQQQSGLHHTTQVHYYTYLVSSSYRWTASKEIGYDAAHCLTAYLATKSGP